MKEESHFPEYFQENFEMFHIFLVKTIFDFNVIFIYDFYIL